LSSDISHEKQPILTAVISAWLIVRHCRSTLSVDISHEKQPILTAVMSAWLVVRHCRSTLSVDKMTSDNDGPCGALARPLTEKNCPPVCLFQVDSSRTLSSYIAYLSITALTLTPPYISLLSVQGYVSSVPTCWYRVQTNAVDTFVSLRCQSCHPVSGAKVPGMYSANIRKLEMMAIAMHCNLMPSDVAPVVFLSTTRPIPSLKSVRSVPDF